MKTDRQFRQTSGFFIIDLALKTSDLRFISACIIDLRFATQSDYELISFNLEIHDSSKGIFGPSPEVTSWDIKIMAEYQEQIAY